MMEFGKLSVTCEATYSPSIAADSNGIKAAGLAKTLIQDMTGNSELENLHGVPTWTDHQMFSLFSAEHFLSG